MIETKLEALTAYLRQTPDEHVQLADTASAEWLAQLYAEATLMQDALGRSVFPFIDQTARTRFLDRGSDAFEVAYRTLNITLPSIPPLSLPYTLDGYRAEVDAEREAVQQARDGFEKERDQTVRYLQALMTALSDAFGEKLVEAIVTQAREREAARFRDGILSEAG